MPADNRNVIKPDNNQSRPTVFGAFDPPHDDHRASPRPPAAPAQNEALTPPPKPSPPAGPIPKEAISRKDIHAQFSQIQLVPAVENSYLFCRLFFFVFPLFIDGPINVQGDTVTYGYVLKYYCTEDGMGLLREILVEQAPPPETWTPDALEDKASDVDQLFGGHFSNVNALNETLDRLDQALCLAEDLRDMIEMHSPTFQVCFAI
jgi:hypothetical protein